MGKDYYTQLRSDGQWETKREGAVRATVVTKTQKEAWEENKELAKKAKSEAFLKNKEGKIRERNTYKKDPFPPKG